MAARIDRDDPERDISSGFCAARVASRRFGSRKPFEAMTSLPYIELRARTAFSFLEGATTPEDLADRAAELGYPAIAMGDRDGVYGHPRFYQAAKKAGVKAIVGADLTLEDDSRLYLLVPDRERYRNLCRMITASKCRILRHDGPLGVDGNPPPIYPAKGESRISFDDLDRFGAGLICLAGGARRPISARP